MERSQVHSGPLGSCVALIPNSPNSVNKILDSLLCKSLIYPVVSSEWCCLPSAFGAGLGGVSDMLNRDQRGTILPFNICALQVKHATCIKHTVNQKLVLTVCSKWSHTLLFRIWSQIVLIFLKKLILLFNKDALSWLQV